MKYVRLLMVVKSIVFVLFISIVFNKFMSETY